MWIDRILEAVLIVLMIKAGVTLVGPDTLGRRRLPVVSIAVTAVLIAGALLELVWFGALTTLRDDSVLRQAHGQWWRWFTAPFVQDGGVLGALFNIVTAAIVIALVEWYWGRIGALAIFLVGAWVPIGDVAGWVGYHVSSQDTAAYSSGSSGATYFTAATLCGALLLAGVGVNRWLALAGPVLAAGIWIIENDGHGVVSVLGFMFGLLIWLVASRFRPTTTTSAINGRFGALMDRMVANASK